MASSNYNYSLFAIYTFLSLLDASLIKASGTSPHYIKFINLESNSNTTNHRHKWVGPSGHRLITVDVNGFGDFRSVQAAVDSVTPGNQKNVVIQISAGYYMEKVVVPASKPYITIKCNGKNLILYFASCTLSVCICHHFMLLLGYMLWSKWELYLIGCIYIWFQNTAPAPMPGMHGWQAVAFRISGDKAYFSGCGFYGAQDTLCDDAGRHYFKECYIEGSIDFIFGNGRSMYKDCELHSIAKRFGSIAAQDRKSPYEKTGFAFVRCRVTGTGPLYVGRAMGQYSRIVFSYTYFDDVVAPGGWDDWDHISNKNKTVFFGVYKCWGPGAASAMGGVSWARELQYELAHPFLYSFIHSFFLIAHLN
ncbi:hypothetical protein RHSIM_Rhsim02G0096100 [Rhododendron simsii]|uniref:Pectinesterase n=1 Tax=Rhododendron simsii TaxID=118357 RepID=A0A834HB80_RHOSS|nr:hypothetical protein RHSIM_Rhsim02G0096100 [Rhododendron simsii]